MGDSPRLESLRRRVLADPASIAFAALAEEYRRAGRLDEAIETARAGLQRHPPYASARVTLGRALFESGQVAEARRELEQALTSAPENLAALRALADLYRSTGVHARALDLARRGAALAPQDQEWRAFLATVDGPEARRAAPPPVIPFGAGRTRADRDPAPPPPPLEFRAVPLDEGPGAPGAASVAETGPSGQRVVVVDQPVVASIQPESSDVAALERWLDTIVRERLLRAGQPEI
jgi:tetratricopeptide (TPR) repeat protein